VGRKKKVAFASILANNPEVLILDEPTNDLDSKSIRFFARILKQLKDVGKTLIVSTHHFDLLFRLADYTILLSPDHRILKIGTTKEILEDKNLLLEAEVIDEEFEV
jgi:cobalt/nickel transport system ATP-binding protein